MSDVAADARRQLAFMLRRDGFTYKEIGQRLGGISVERTRQIVLRLVRDIEKEAKRLRNIDLKGIAMSFLTSDTAAMLLRDLATARIPSEHYICGIYTKGENQLFFATELNNGTPFINADYVMSQLEREIERKEIQERVRDADPQGKERAAPAA